jgi:peptidoglycan/xylan/chitin deacetylase (PgdA/CDA1 family)
MPKRVLTYHMTRVDEWSREGSDLLGLRADLALLIGRGVAIHPLETLLDPACASGVAITFDDGTRIDAESIRHPRWGVLPSALSILAEASERCPGLTASTFVIASPTARDELARGLVDDYGPDLMHDRWWPEAQRTGLLQVENHSWDHNHPLVARSCQRDNVRGTFLNIDTDDECEAEIAAASEYIERRCGRRPRYLAYPYGEASPFLRERFLPARGAGVGLQAAFSTEPRPLANGDDRWFLPRYVSGRDWKTDAGLLALLDD